ncbi:hypothetical protein LSAT2_003192 [Lamellibrachia satsuma]|nr:hypothetical protein LSAT2_003192 [Lamellibrachia satsuma]
MLPSLKACRLPKSLGLSSIALPALSCGIFHYPLDKATKTIVSALKDFLEDKQHTCVKKVSLVDRSENIVRELRNSLGVVFGRDMTSSRRGQDSSHKTGNGHRIFRGAENQPLQSPQHHRRTHTDTATTQLKTPEGITLSLCKSEIAKEKVDVIVNSTNCQLQLERGYVSKALLDRGGQTLQRECQQNAPNGIKCGEVVVTSGGQLNCQFVIHGACCRWDGGTGNSEQVLRTFLANCFQEADNNNITSIAIPPIGTGQLDFDPHFGANIMLEELCQFSRRNHQTTLRDVRFVVYERDDRIIQAFEEVLFKSYPSRHEIGRGLAGASPRHDEGDIGLPANWTRMGDREHVKLESLHRSSSEYKMVEKDIMRTAAGHIRGVTKIERVQNPTLYRHYVLRKGDIKKRRIQPTTIERKLWHGTSVDATGNINNGGFNRSYCGKNATAYGQGVYFAVNSSYSAQGYASPDASGHKKMYRSLVLTGYYTQGKSSMRDLPDNHRNPGFPYDSAVDNPGSPTISGGGTVDDKVGKDTRYARESSPQPGRKLRGGKVTGRREMGRKGTGGKTTGVKERGVGETGGKEKGVGETGGKTTGGKEKGVGEMGEKTTGVKERGVGETGGKEKGVGETEGKQSE